MTSYFGPIPKSSIDQDRVMQYVQRNAHTFYQQLALRGISVTSLTASGDVTVGGEVFLADGSASAPSLSFSATGQQDVGIFRGGTDEIAFAVGGTEVATIEPTGLELNLAGTAAAPTIYYSQATTTGFYWAPGGAAGVGVAVSGSEVFRAAAAQLQLIDGSAGTPSLSFSTAGQTDVGLYRAGTDQIALSTGGSEAVTFDIQGITNHNKSGLVHARAQNTSADTIPTTEAVVLTGALTIPAAWGGYAIQAWASSDITETGTLTGNRNVIHRIRLTDTSGTVMGLQEISVPQAAPNRMPVSVVGYLTGQTATGTVNVVFTHICATDNNQVSSNNSTLIVQANRTS